MLLSVSAFTANTLLLRYLSGASVGLSPEMPLLFRSAVGMILVFVFFRGRRPTRLRPVLVEKGLILRGITGLLGTAAYYWTVPNLGAGMATLICNTYVIFASLIAILALGERLSVSRLIWLAASFAGIVCLLGPGADSTRFQLGWYEAIAIAGAIIAATSVILIRHLVAKHSIGTIYLAQCVWILLPVALLAGPDLAGLEQKHWLLLVVAGTFAGAGQLLMNEGYRCLPVSLGASIQMLWPVATATGGWLLFRETLTGVQLVGAAIVLTSIWRMSAKV